MAAEIAGRVVLVRMVRDGRDLAGRMECDRMVRDREAQAVPVEVVRAAVAQDPAADVPVVRVSDIQF